MGRQQLPPIDELASLPESAQTAALDLLFEPSPAIHSTLVPVIRNASFSSYPELIDQCRAALFQLAAASTPTSPDHTLLAVVGSHPRLGAKKVDSAQSNAEQASLQAPGEGESEGEHLAALNREYEEKFPGLRFVVFVNGRGRPEIMEDMRVRIDRADYAQEIDAALQASALIKCQEGSQGFQPAARRNFSSITRFCSECVGKPTIAPSRSLKRLYHVWQIAGVVVE
ncbi:hypothetical protein E4U42_004108 [Claviceps africana]|uniref:Oxo-4-hydroxy-4-carboxy-5-ureidoimidazoline decarboxylase domain-containing protein n=1 Tax=Claviceps africana TaxID=83212 RepID=A0A8K0J5Y6_9HYPO|nr:hypothetical protein E4U42_004108 [Claviceps africana]